MTIARISESVRSTLVFALIAGAAAAASGQVVTLQSDLAVAAQISRKITQDNAARQAAYALAAAATNDTDGYALPPAPVAAATLAGGGAVPTSTGAPATDGFGVKMGYCAWDNGTSTAATGYLPGTNSLAAVTVAVVSPGADNQFSTTCAQIAAGQPAAGDDYYVAYSAGQILAGVQGTSYFADPVDTQADLTAIAAGALKDGQVRLVKATNQLYRYTSATSSWASVSSQWLNSAVPGDINYTAGNVAIGTAVAQRKLTVQSAGVPIGVASAGARNGIDMLDATTAAVNAFFGFDSGTNAVRVEAGKAGSAIVLATAGGTVNIASTGVLNAPQGITTAGLTASSITSTGPITTSALQSSGPLSITSTALSVSGPTTFAGAITGTNGTFSGTLSAATVSATTVSANAVLVGGNAVWHAGNFDPANYVSRAGDTMAGSLAIAVNTVAGTSALSVQQSGGGDILRLKGAGGVDRLRVDTNGTLRIASIGQPWAVFQGSSVDTSYMGFLRGGSTTAAGYIGTDGGSMVTGGAGDAFGVRSEGPLILAAGGDAERVRITAAGQVLIGTTANPANAQVMIGHAGANPTALVVGDATNPANATGLYLRTTGTASITMAGSALTFGAPTSELMRLSGTGDLHTVGQVRATGWYGGSTTGVYKGLAAEMGVSGTTGYVVAYNRNANAYGNMTLQGANVDLSTAGGSATVNGNAIWHTGNDSNLMKYRGGVDGPSGGMDGATANGFYAVAQPGYTDGMLTFNGGGSAGAVQLRYTYWGDWNYRSKVDNTTWYAWKSFVTSDNFAGTAKSLPNVTTLNGYSPTNGAIRMTSNLFMNSVAGTAVIVNWDNGAAAGDMTFRIGKGNASGDAHIFWANGNYAANGTISAVGYVTSSDARFKSSIASLDANDLMKRFMDARPVGYVLNSNGQYNTGYIAQELQPLFPHMVQVIDAEGHLGVTYQQMVPVLHAVVQSQQRAIERLKQSKLDNATDKWLESEDKKSRLYFERDGKTLLRGHGDIAVEIRNAEDQALATFRRSGELELAGMVRFSGATGGFSFNPTGTIVSSSKPGEIVVGSASALRAAVRLQHAAGAEGAERVYGLLFGDESGVGLADASGRALLTASTISGASIVQVNASLVLGDKTSTLRMAGDTSITASGDGSLQLEARGGVRVYNPKSKDVVVSLGSDGNVQARRFTPTEVVEQYSSCDSEHVGSIARDSNGQTMVCAR